MRLRSRDALKGEVIAPDPDWQVLHRRGPRRIQVGIDPLEARAVPKSEVRGFLPERIMHRYLTDVVKWTPGIHFDFQCLAGHHRVLTSDLRWVPISSLNVGDELLAFGATQEPPANGVKDRKHWRRNYQTTKVVHNKRDVAECYKVTLSDGLEVIATPEHPWLTLGRMYNGKRIQKKIKGDVAVWATTSELEIGTRLPVYFHPWETENTREAAYLAAFLDGEGSISHKTRHGRENGLTVGFGQNEGPVLQYALSCLRALEVEYGVSTHKDRRWKSKPEINYVRINGGRAGALRFLGMAQPIKIGTQLDLSRLGRLDKIEEVTVSAIEFIGRHEIYRLATESETYIAEGLGMHNSSMDGGRVEIGGLVADFIIFHLRLILNPMGPTHETFIRKAKDEENEMTYAEFGYTQEAIPEAKVYDEAYFEAWMRKVLGFTTGAAGGAGTFRSERTSGPPDQWEDILDQVQQIHASVAGM